MMKILFLTKYTYAGASSRYRTYQYLPIFRKENYCKILPFFFLNISNNSIKRYLYSLWRIFDRVKVLFICKKFDFLYIEKELIPYFPPILEYVLKILGVKYILDYDDAIFHNYDSAKSFVVKWLLRNKISCIMRWASGVVTGSPYLTSYARQFNYNVIEIPTSIDINRYPITQITTNKFVIGWIGSKSTSKYIIDIWPALVKFLQLYPSSELHLIGFENTFLQSKVIPNNLVIIPWNENIEFQELCNISVGIMPLNDDPFSQGKCGFKLIQYMACSKPTISTPLMANIKIDRNGENLFANTLNDWYMALEEVYCNQTKYKKVGERNRKIVEQYYSIQMNWNTYLDFLKKL